MKKEDEHALMWFAGLFFLSKYTYDVVPAMQRGGAAVYDWVHDDAGHKNDLPGKQLTRAAVLKALQTLDEDFETATAIVAVAKARAGSTATLAVQEAVQMHGGIGMTDEFEIGFFMKRARVCQELFGDANFHADRLARLYGY